MTLCFEDETLSRLYRKDSLVLSFSDFVFRLTGQRAPCWEEQKKRLAELLTPAQKERVESYLLTLHHLRQALILSPTDVDYCFSLLSPTPKNKDLCEVFHKYLDSPLANDWTSLLWETVGGLKQGKEIPFEEDITFLKAECSSYLFGEVANALSYAPNIENVSIRDTWDEGLEETPCFKGPALSLLSELGHRVLELVRGGTNPKDILIPFHAKESLEKIFRLFLEHHHLNEVTLAPFHPVSKMGDKPVLAFTDATLFQIETPSLLLEPLEIETLHLQGFHLWRVADQVERRKAFVKAFTTRLSSHTCFFVDHELKSLPASAKPITNARAFSSRGEPPKNSSSTVRHASPRTIRSRPEIISHFGHHILGPSLNAPHSQNPQHTEEYASGFVQSDRPNLTPTCGPKCEIISGRLLSASQLETYAQCPAKYFFSHRLKLQPPAKDWATRYALVFGSATHQALENFLTPCQEQAISVNPFEGPEASSLLINYFNQAVKLLEPKLKETDPLFLLLQKNFSACLKHIFKNENELRSRFGKLTPMALEHRFEFKLGDIRLTGRIDRLDRTEDNQMLIYDYKTGTVSFSPVHIGNGVHFQVLLYLLSTEEMFDNVSGMVFYDLKKGEVRRGLLKEETLSAETKKTFTRGHVMEEEKRLSLLAQGKEHLINYAAAIERGYFEAKPSQNCGVCDYSAFCRQGEGYV